jgi:hypothetical protein
LIDVKKKGGTKKGQQIEILQEYPSKELEMGLVVGIGGRVVQ